MQIYFYRCILRPKLTVVLLIAASFVSQNSLAQLGQFEQQDKRTTMPRPVKSKQQQLQDNSLYITKSIPAPISMPNVPDYTGIKPKFISGLSCPNLQNGRHCVSQRFLTRETPDIVMDWYEQALRQAQWTIEPRNKRPTAIVAENKKNNAYCHVSVVPSFQPGYKAYLEVRYTETGKAPQE